MAYQSNFKETYRAGKEVRDWGTDGCSSAPDKFFNVDLQECCAEHDFYYRNKVKVSRWEADNRLRRCIAQKVKDKLGFKGWILATVYWTGVRVGGASSYHDYTPPEDDDHWYI